MAAAVPPRRETAASLEKLPSPDTVHLYERLADATGVAGREKAQTALSDREYSILE